MGATIWSDAHYRDRAAYLRVKGKTAFAFDDDIRAQRVAAGVNRLMDPARLKNGVRESRDSETHVNSTAIAVLCDVTGSMRQVPRIVQRSLCTLFRLLVERHFVSDPAVLVGGVGDATCDMAPLQVGQFESGNEIEDDLSRLYLEGGGGGQMTESYELALYFLARKTSIDCYERRGHRGYAFLIGDEMPYRRVKRREVEDVFGDSLKRDIPLRDIVAEAQEKYDIYYVLPKLTSYYDCPAIVDCWQDLLGKNVLRLSDPGGISELIAATIGLAEQAVTFRDLTGELRSAGTSSRTARAIARSLRDHVEQIPGTRLAKF